ncbi:MAG: MarR family winged helix-turn-helix transcriptional regulator [Spirochaetota bacterium]
MKIRTTLSLISRIKKESDALIVRELEKNGIEGIVPSHGGILNFLYQNQTPMTMKEVADAIHKTQPTVTVLVNKLVDLGYAERIKSTEDGRICRIALTEKGTLFQKVFIGVSDALNKKVHQSLTDKEADMLESLLAKISAGFDIR